MKASEAAVHEEQLARIETDLALLRWMTGAVMAGVAMLVIKAFG